MEIIFDCVYIIESLPTEGRRTGSELYSDLLKREEYKNDGFKAILETPTTKIEFTSLLDRILQECIESGRSPVIHFEIHGSTDHKGLVLASGEFVGWDVLSDKLRAINCQLKNGLLITMGVCHGCYFMSHEIATKPAVFQAIIASFAEVTENDIYMQFYDFYQELFSSFDLNLAYDKLIQANPETIDKANYAFLSSEYIFARSMVEYDEKKCTRKAFEQRALETFKLSKIKFANIHEKQKAINVFIEQGLRTRNKYFQDAYDTFFMLDKYPDLQASVPFPRSILGMKEWYKKTYLD